MVNIITRMRKLRALLWIRCGPGALILPKEVSKISMEFNRDMAGGHRGARKFWQEMLPRIKYRNPAVPVQITRHNDPSGPSRLHIFTTPSDQTPPASQPTPPSSSTTPTPPSATPNVQTTLTPDTSSPTHTIDIKNQDQSQILAALIKAVNPEVLEPSEQELQELAEQKEFEERSEKDRVMVKEKLEKVRREQELLRLARGEGVATA